MAMRDDAAAAVLEEVVEVAADLARRGEARGDFGVLQGGALLRQETKLQLACKVEVVLEALFLAGDALVEAGVLDGDGHLRRHGGHDADVLIVEISAPGVFDVEHADDLLFVDERHAQVPSGFQGWP